MRGYIVYFLKILCRQAATNNFCLLTEVDTLYVQPLLVTTRRTRRVMRAVAMTCCVTALSVFLKRALHTSGVHEDIIQNRVCTQVISHDFDCHKTLNVVHACCLNWGMWSRTKVAVLVSRKNEQAPQHPQT